jgi:hypothetical protein
MIKQIFGSIWGFLLLCMPPVIFPLLLPTFVSQDGPSHIGTSAVISGVLHGDNNLEDAFYLTGVPTNMLAHFLLVPFMHHFDGRLIEKVFVSFLIFGGAWGVWFCAGGKRAANPWICAFAAVSGYTTTLYAGNYNFILSIVIMLFVVGILYRRCAALRNIDFLIISLLFILSALAHPVGLVFAASTVTAHP